MSPITTSADSTSLDSITAAKSAALSKLQKLQQDGRRQKRKAVEVKPADDSAQTRSDVKKGSNKVRKVIDNSEQALQSKPAAAPTAAADSTADDQLKSTANNSDQLAPWIYYLQQWHTDRSNFKFRKLRQTQLLRAAYDKQHLPKKWFAVFLQYIQGLQGKQREQTLAEAKHVIAKYTAKEYTAAAEVDADEAEHEARRQYKRALQVQAALETTP